MNKKYAICAGINDYPGVASDLSGCLNDALDWRDLLESEGYDVETLFDANVTRDNLVLTLTKAVALLGFGDRLVFTYSGHGTWVPDQSGDEPDRRDEALACYDYQTGGLLLDDILETIISSQKYGARVLILSDSCHSGTLTRDLNPTPTDARFVSPALLECVPSVDMERAVEMEQKAAGTPRRTASLISGCTDQEYSYDAQFATRPNGAFTRSAIDAYYSGVALGPWYDLIRQRLPTDYYPQTPQLTTTYYRGHTRAL